MKNLITSALLVMAPVMASAHSGAHEPGLAESLIHLATQPDHWFIFALVVVPSLIVVAIRHKKKSRQRGKLTQ